MKILFFGDYSNLHACLAAELEKRGHEVTVISDGGRYLDTRRDILLDREPGMIGTVHYMWRLFNLIPKLRDYDVVQLINPHFLSLRPGKIKYFFDLLRSQNRSVFLTLAGDDAFFARACMDGHTFRFSEFKVGNRRTEFEKLTHRGEKWSAPALLEFGRYLYDNIDGAMSVLPEYDIASRPLLGDKLKFTNIPVDLGMLPYGDLHISDRPLRLFIGIRGGTELQKGTGELLRLCRELESEMPDKIQTTMVTNLPLRDYLQRMSECDIVLDQLYSYSPGTNGFQAMALGRVAATGGQPEFYEYLGNPPERPIIALSPLELDSLRRTLTDLAKDRTPLIEMGRQGRRLVEKHNDVHRVADKFEQHWLHTLNSR